MSNPEEMTEIEELRMRVEFGGEMADAIRKHIWETYALSLPYLDDCVMAALHAAEERGMRRAREALEPVAVGSEALLVVDALIEAHRKEAA